MGDTWEFWRGVVRICQDHYPERCEACFVLNIPPFFSFIYKLARAFINPTTLKKVQVSYRRCDRCPSELLIGSAGAALPGRLCRGAAAVAPPIHQPHA